MAETSSNTSYAGNTAFLAAARASYPGLKGPSGYVPDMNKKTQPTDSSPQVQSYQIPEKENFRYDKAPTSPMLEAIARTRANTKTKEPSIYREEEQESSTTNSLADNPIETFRRLFINRPRSMAA